MVRIPSVDRHNRILRYLFFVYIPKKAVAEKKIVNQLFDFIRETIKGLKELKPAYEEILVQRGQKLKYKGLKVALMPGCIDKSIAMYEELLRKPAGYYAGKHLLTISRIYQLKVVAGDARNELDTLQQLLEDIRES